MKYEIVYGGAGNEPVVIGAVTARTPSDAYRMVFQAIDEKLWPRIRTKPWTKRGSSASG